MNPISMFLAFLIASVAIVSVTTCLLFPNDYAALRHFPTRLMVFVGSCAGLLALMLLLEYLFVTI